MTRFDDAMVLAAKAHAGQRDKADVPYILHPAAVAATVAEYGETAMIVALLHDVVEDTSISIETIEERFGEDVARPVALLTKPAGDEVDYDAYLDGICSNPIAAVVKLADMRHNLSRLDALEATEAERLRRKYETRITRLEAAVSGEPVTLSFEVQPFPGLGIPTNPTWASLYVMVSDDGAVAKIGACERLANVPQRQKAVEKKYRQRVLDLDPRSSGTMRVVVKIELVGLSLFSGPEYQARWADTWAEVEAREYALRFAVAQRVGRMHEWADYIHVREAVNDEDWVTLVRSAWSGLPARSMET